MKGKGCVEVYYVPILSSPTGEPTALTTILSGTGCVVTRANFLGKIQMRSAGTLGWIIVLLSSPTTLILNVCEILRIARTDECIRKL